MIEYKIRFISGDIAYYKASESQVNPEEITKAFNKFFTDGEKGSIALIDCIDGQLPPANLAKCD